jgi:hypothetical protein
MCHRRVLKIDTACKLIRAGFAANLVLYAGLQEVS